MEETQSITIKDCIYRFIEIPPLCKKFIDTFQTFVILK